jgi:hypothetical protein
MALMFEDGEQLANCSLNPSNGNNLSMGTRREAPDAHDSRLQFHYAPQPNCRFNADANTGHGFAIFMASVGALRASRSGAG